LAKSARLVYFFGGGKADGKAADKDLLGGKGANLAEMTRIGLPVPSGFTISTEVCASYYANRKQIPPGLEDQVHQALRRVERTMGAAFGDASAPLLLSVRSGARVSMPGMMDTVLNLGLNDNTVQGLIEQTANPRFAYDSYRRFVQMYGDVVLGMKPMSSKEIDPFEALLEKKKRQRGVVHDNDLSALDLKDLVGRFKNAIRERTGKPFPEDPFKQLWGAIAAVFGSWMNDRAIAYRKLNGISSEWGTAVNVQAMVFGNMGDDSGTGVAFTRDPATGENKFYGEFLINAQGEDVVAGTRTPLPIEKLKSAMPKVYKQLLKIQHTLEGHYREMQDTEFTIQRNKLWMLQTRSGKRTGKAAVRIAVDMVEEKLISREEAR
jgi:pyruvate,orthophosphate dikinase